MKTLKVLAVATTLVAMASAAFAAPVSNNFVIQEDSYTQRSKPTLDCGINYWVNAEGPGQGSYESHGWLKWNASTIKNYFDAQFGIGAWQITGITLTGYSNGASFYNYGTLNLYHNSNDAWAAGNNFQDQNSPAVGNEICWNNESTYLGTLTYLSSNTRDWKATKGQPAGFDAFNAAVIDDIMNGTDALSFFMDADGSAAGGFESKEGSQAPDPFLFVTAEAVPEPGSFLALASGLFGLIGCISRRRLS
jgi:hypothetical protein